MDAKKSLWVGSVLLTCSNCPPASTFPRVMGNQPGRFPVSGAVDLPVGFTSSKIVSLAL